MPVANDIPAIIIPIKTSAFFALRKSGISESDANEIIINCMIVAIAVHKAIWTRLGDLISKLPTGALNNTPIVAMDAHLFLSPVMLKQCLYSLLCRYAHTSSISTTKATPMYDNSPGGLDKNSIMPDK